MTIDRGPVGLTDSALHYHNREGGRFEGSREALTIEAQPGTNYFVGLDGKSLELNAPVIEFEVSDTLFTLQCRVSTSLDSIYDAAGLIVRTDEGRWAKLVVELSPFKIPTIVTVVTKDTSDDGNGEELASPEAYLRVHKNGDQYALHWSLDGHFWKLARWFALPAGFSSVRMGLIAQAPLGSSCLAKFDKINTFQGVLLDPRNGA